MESIFFKATDSFNAYDPISVFYLIYILIVSLSKSSLLEHSQRGLQA